MMFLHKRVGLWAPSQYNVWYVTNPNRELELLQLRKIRGMSIGPGDLKA